ncbi:MAG: type II secretion system F family protein [Lachnospiraceae bacterium]|nr:type II secretion system F family protein [Lachnospiraceae bacterium]
MSKKKKKSFSPDEISTFCSQIAMLLNGGIPLYEGAYMLHAEMEDGETKAVLEEIDNKVKEGLPFYQAIEETGAFPAYMVHMVEVGENTGKLEEIMRSLAAYYERECNVRASIKSIIVYPAMLFIMMAVILGVLVTKILPMFEDVFKELDSKTKTAETMMSSSLVASRVVAVVVIVMVVIMVSVLIWYRSKNGENALSSLIDSMPFTKKLAVILSTGKFLAALSAMVSSGMENTEAVERAGQVIENKTVLAKVEKCREMLSMGSDFDAAMNETGIVSGMQGRMLGVGVKAGATDTVLEKLSKQYDDDISDRMSSLAAYIETGLVIFLSVIVGVVLISVMMPLVSVIASI